METNHRYQVLGCYKHFKFPVDSIPELFSYFSKLDDYLSIEKDFEQIACSDYKEVILESFNDHKETLYSFDLCSNEIDILIQKYILIDNENKDILMCSDFSEDKIKKLDLECKEYILKRKKYIQE